MGQRSHEAGVAARAAAVDLLAEVLRAGASLDDLFAPESATGAKALAGLSAQDRSFVRALTATALRHNGELTHVLSQFLTKPLPKSSGLAREVLLMGAAQLLFMRVPAHAAIATAVDVARADRNGQHFSGLINAVLRKVASQGEALLAGLDAAQLNTPGWLMRRWQARYGEASAHAIATAHQQEAALDLTIKDQAARDLWAQRLKGEAIGPVSVRLGGHSGRIEELEGYGEGAWWVQDLAASLPATLLGDVRDLSVLDLCAAPGGKSAQLAAAGARVIAVDESAQRLERLAANLARLQLDVRCVQADARQYQPDMAVDAVLLDAPCSATGTIRRHPDLPLHRQPAAIAVLAGMQRDMLAHAAGLLKPGGRLVLCTCSLEFEEGEAHLDNLPDGLVLDPLQPGEVFDPALISAPGVLRTLPSQAMDGFFAARFRRV